MKTKFMGWLTGSAVVMLAFPWAAITFAKGDTGMAIAFLLFFVINPVYAIAAGVFAGKNSERMWSLPVITAVLFLLGAWLFFGMGEWAFVGYAGVYLVIGMASLLVSSRISAKRRR